MVECWPCRHCAPGTQTLVCNAILERDSVCSYSLTSLLQGQVVPEAILREAGGVWCLNAGAVHFLNSKVMLSRWKTQVSRSPGLCVPFESLEA